jgi:hypothetical protein
MTLPTRRPAAAGLAHRQAADHAGASIISEKGSDAAGHAQRCLCHPRQRIAIDQPLNRAGRIQRQAQ